MKDKAVWPENKPPTKISYSKVKFASGIVTAPPPRTGLETRSSSVLMLFPISFSLLRMFQFNAHLSHYIQFVVHDHIFCSFQSSPCIGRSSHTVDPSVMASEL